MLRGRPSRAGFVYVVGVVCWKNRLPAHRQCRVFIIQTESPLYLPARSPSRVRQTVSAVRRTPLSRPQLPPSRPSVAPRSPLDCPVGCPSVAPVYSAVWSCIRAIIRSDELSCLISRVVSGEHSESFPNTDGSISIG